MIGVSCLWARENWQLFYTAYKGDKTNHLDLCQRRAENPGCYKVILDVTKMYMKLYLYYSTACKRDTDRYMWVHVGTKTVLIAWKKTKTTNQTTTKNPLEKSLCNNREDRGVRTVGQLLPGYFFSNSLHVEGSDCL